MNNLFLKYFIFSGIYSSARILYNSNNVLIKDLNYKNNNFEYRYITNTEKSLILLLSLTTCLCYTPINIINDLHKYELIKRKNSEFIKNTDKIDTLTDLIYNN